MRFKLLVVLTSVLATTAFADEYNNDGWYFDLGAGASKTENLPTGAANINVNVGYEFTKGLGLEVGWIGMPSQQYGSFDNYNVYDLALKGSIPMGDTFSLYGRLGVGAGYSSWSGTPASPSPQHIEGNSWNTVGVAGVGVAFKVSPSFSLYLENNNYIPITSSAGSFGYTPSALFGFQYNFSATKSATPENTSSYNDVKNETPYSAPIVESVVATSMIESQPQPVHKPEQLKYADLSSRIIIEPSGKKYLIVKEDDTIYNIAYRTSVSEANLRKINRIRNNRILAGQKLYLN